MLHPRRPAPQLAHGLVAAQQQLGHHGQLDLIHAQPVVEIMAVLLHSPVAFDQPDGADGPQPIERLFHLVRFELHQRPAVVLLVAAGADGGQAHGIDVGCGLGLFRQNAGDAPFDGADRLPPPLGRPGLRRAPEGSLLMQRSPE